MKFRLVSWMGALVFAWAVPVFASQGEIRPSEICPNRELHLTVENLGSQTRSGYIGEGSSAAFSLKSKESREITLRTSEASSQHRLVAVLPEETQCTGYVELPSGCAPQSPAAHMYLYEGSRGYRCFIRTVAHLPRYSDTIALR